MKTVIARRCSEPANWFGAACAATLASVFLVAATLPVTAQTAEPPPVPGPPPAGRPGLSLEDCRRLAVRNNLVLRAQREALLAAGYLSRAELGAFEPEFVASAERVENERENTIEQTISQGTSFFHEDNNVYGSGVEGVAPSGTRYRLGYTVRDLENNLRVRSTDPFRNEWQTFLGLTLTQPLLKDNGVSATLARVRLARGEEALALQEYRRQTMLVVGAVEAAYWELHVARGRDRFRRESIAAAEQLLAENRARVDEGKMAEIELIEAESGLAHRRSLGAEASQRLVEAAARLKTLVAEPIAGDDWMIVTADQPPAPASASPIEEALRDAFALHPEYLARAQRAEQEGVRVDYARNQRRPQIDLKGSYGYNGLGLDHDRSWDDISRGRYESWSVGVEMRLPVAGGVRRGNELQAARARQRQALFDLEAAKIEITNNLHGARRRIESLLAVSADYDQVAAADRRLLENELSRLGEGKSESRRVLEIEGMLADARIAALESRGEYEKARIEFELACGRLLRSRGLEPVVAEAVDDAKEAAEHPNGPGGDWEPEDPAYGRRGRRKL